MLIGNFNISKKILLVAEIGNNHEGNFNLAKKLIDEASKNGADAVKFQTINPKLLISEHLDTKRLKQLKKFQLTLEQFRKLYLYSKKRNLIFLSTPFDFNSAKYLNNFIPAFKIASSDNNFFPFLKYLSRFNKPIILSTGLANFNQIKKSVKYLDKFLNIKKKLVLLHCVSIYPTPIEKANLIMISKLKKLSTLVGYSDHTIGNDAAIMAAALGARIIEKHFTIDKNYSKFRDHQLSSDPKDFYELSNKIHKQELLLGSEKFNISSIEKLNIQPLRRSIVASKDLLANKTLTYKDLNWTRPGSGLLSGNENKILGKKLKKNIQSGEQIKLIHLKK